MRKNYYLRAAVLLLALFTLTSGVFMGTGTMAKYIAAGEGAATARVAKFSVKLTDGTTDVQLAETAGVVKDLGAQTYVTKLFSPFYANVAGGNTPTTATATTNSVEAKNGTDKIVAPGTMSAATNTIMVWNESEVTVDVKIQILSVTGVGADDPPVLVPLRINNVAVATTFPQTLATLTLPPNQTKPAAAITTAGATQNAVNLTWEWPFSPNGDTVNATARGAGNKFTAGTDPDKFTISNVDYYDTVLGIRGTDQVNITFRILAEQVD